MNFKTHGGITKGKGSEIHKFLTLKYIICNIWLHDKNAQAYFYFWKCKISSELNIKCKVK